MNKPSISVQNISKCYHAYDNQCARMLHALRPSRRKGVTDIWALRNINFEVNQGESIGIIGRNGAGKSTLLEIISNTLTPTTGSIHVEGKVAALLELGSGFNPEFTGEENIFLNGFLLGLSKPEIETRFDEIVSFADIGPVLNRQVKTYSSGMLMRLAFAVQVAINPEILIVDEALSVGDYFFQQKCFGRLQKMRDDGLTLLFVSHNMGTVRDICNRVLYLKQGAQEYFGESSEAIRLYFLDGRSLQANKAIISSAPPCLEPIDSVIINKITSSALWSAPPLSKIQLFAVNVMNQEGEQTTSSQMGSKIIVRVYFKLLGSGNPLTIGLIIKNKYDQTIFSTHNRLLGIELIDRNDQPLEAFEFELELSIEAGLYSFQVTITNPSLSSENNREYSDWLGPIQINWQYESSPPPFLGMFGIPAKGRNLFFESNKFF